MATIPSFVSAEIIDNRRVAEGHFLLEIDLPRSFPTPSPGQFVMVRDPDRAEPLLPRPISIYGFRREEGRAVMGLLCRIVGRGTALLSRLTPGRRLSLLAPLGRGFRIDPDVRSLLLVGGGVGSAPLALLLEGGSTDGFRCDKGRTKAYLGAANAELLTGLHRFEGFCDLKVATDDGSRGYHGPVTSLLAADLAGCNEAETLILACGPPAMVRSLAALLRESRIRCQVSLEERMACAVGACLGCAVAVREGEGRTGYRRVCHDGPVFDLAELVWDPPLER